jgi:hypothetical protein
MTDEERKKLCEDLRVADYYRTDGTARKTRHEAANEIERLAKENGRLTQALIDKLAAYSAKDSAMTDEKITAAQTLEAIGLNDATVAALLKELKENAMPKSDAEPQDPLPHEHQDPSKWPTRETVERAHALTQSNAEPIPLYEDIERILDDESAWIARPNPRVTMRIAIAAFMKAQSVLAQSDAEPVAWQEALEQQLLDLVELARDTRSDKGGEARWTHPIGALTREFAKRIAAPPRPDASAGLIEAAVRAAFEEAAQIADSFGDRHAEYEPGDAIRARAADRSGK